MKQAVIVRVQEPPQVAEARRRASEAGRKQNLDAESLGRLEIVTTELATNMLAHAKGGEIVITTPREQSIEVIAIDTGPGISDLALSFQDGFSSGRTPGLGLGAIRRQSQRVSVFAPPGKGMVISALVQPASVASLPGIAVICVPVRGESVSGDTWAHAGDSGRELFMIADGLGHGEQAAEASQMAERIFQSALGESPDEIVRRMHNGMKATRGAAVMIVSLDREKRVARWCGVGNISSSLHRPGACRGMVSENGIVGHQTPRFRVQEAPWSPVDVLIMHSDGLSSRWQMENYDGLLPLSSATIAGVLYRDQSRASDDRTILVAKVA